MSIADVGAEALANALKVNASLTGLSLQGNQIGDKGAKALGQALEVNGNIIAI